MSSAFAVPAKDASWYQWATNTEKIGKDPAYQFRTTSIYISETSTSTAVFTPLADTSPRRARKGGFGDPDEYEIGVIPDPAPIGEPLIILLFALMYVVFRYFRSSKRSLF